MIVDVDTHWEITGHNASDDPMLAWADQIPDNRTHLANAIAGDLLQVLPAERLPSPAELLPKLFDRAERSGGPVVLHPRHDSTAAERVAWMDGVGIDHCLVNPGGYWQKLDYLRAEDRPVAARRCNDFLTEQLADQSGRLHAVATIDFSDLDAAVEDLQRCRSRGARAFFLYTRRGVPAGGPPGHPRWDRIWAAAIDLGMVVVIHVGNTEADFTEWADIGWDQPDGAGVGGLIRLANTQRLHAAQNLIASMLFGGVFHRFPDLTVLVEEMRAGWLPWYVTTLSRQSQSSASLGDWPWPTSGADMLHRNLRLTPLPGFGDADALDVLAELPDMVVFSSDYPHQEGNADPIELYRPGLDRLDDDLRAAFLGNTAADAFARMGDPLPAPRSADAPA
ncbi:amidohydrolase family protein [Candidatus Poriferisocius sp.]|uniref:amidohydrolase family protein n=1 Tax=Candidatus Poriferisocius sp. TaxID=3101276 RepID=UPI003B595DB3